MKNIRRSIFETNSSSTHSVFIDESSELLQTIEPDNGVIKVTYGEYGWEEDFFDSPEDKARYALTASTYYNMRENRDMLREVIKEHTGAKRVVFVELEYDFYPEGYIDHQSAESPFEFFESPEKLKAFLFSPKSNFKTDNDNH